MKTASTKTTILFVALLLMVLVVLQTTRADAATTCGVSSANTNVQTRASDSMITAVWSWSDSTCDLIELQPNESIYFSLTLNDNDKGYHIRQQFSNGFNCQILRGASLNSARVKCTVSSAMDVSSASTSMTLTFSEPSTISNVYSLAWLRADRSYGYSYLSSHSTDIR